MKIGQSDFKPVHIILDTEEEVQAIIEALDYVISETSFECSLEEKFNIRELYKGLEFISNKE